MILTPEFELHADADIDDGDLTFADAPEGESQPKSTDLHSVTDAVISWRGDSTVFVCNYAISGARKCLTWEINPKLRVTKGPARADN